METIGIDVGGKTAKIVCIDSLNDGSCQLTGYGLLSYNGDVGLLSNWIKSSHLTGHDVRVNIEDPSMKIRRIDIPPIPEEEWAEAIKWSFKEFISSDPEEYVFRGIKIETEDLVVDEKVPLIGFAIKESAVDQKVDFVKKIGLKRPKIVESDAGALNNIFEYTFGSLREEVSIVIDMGSQNVLFLALGKRGLLYSRPLDGCADCDFVEQIGRDLGVSEEEGVKVRESLFGRNDQKVDEELKIRFNNTLSHLFSKMALNIQRSIDGFLLAFGRKKIGKIYLCGGGSIVYEGLADYLKQNLGFDVSNFDPFAKIGLNQFPPGQLDKNKPLFAVACGLAVDCQKS